APGEQAGDASEDAGPVLHEDGEDVVVQRGTVRVESGHDGGSSQASRSRIDCWVGWTSRSSLANPAGTIGKTFSLASVRNSMTTVRSLIEFAFSIAGPTSS